MDIYCFGQQKRWLYCSNAQAYLLCADRDCADQDQTAQAELPLHSWHICGKSRFSHDVALTARVT